LTDNSLQSADKDQQESRVLWHAIARLLFNLCSDYAVQQISTGKHWHAFMHSPVTT